MKGNPEQGSVHWLATHIHDDAVTLAQVLLLRNLVRNHQAVTERVLVALLRLAQTRQVTSHLRNDQHVRRSQLADVAES